MNYRIEPIVRKLLIKYPNTIVKANSPQGEQWFRVVNKGDVAEEDLKTIIKFSHKYLVDEEAKEYRSGLFDAEEIFNLVYQYQRLLAHHIISEKLSNKAQHKKLTEGTSNFWSMDNFPLLVFGDYDDVYDRVYDMTKDQLGDEFDGEVEETKEFEDNWDMYFDYCVLDEDEVDRLQDKIKNFVHEINADDRHDSYEEADVDIEIKPGYYEAAQIFVDDEKYLFIGC